MASRVETAGGDNRASARQQQDQRAEARQGLAEIYGWCTESFDTADVQEAKALLEDLP